MYPYTFQSYNENQNNNRKPEILEVEEAIGPSAEADTKLLTMMDEALLSEEEGYQYYRKLQNMINDSQDKEVVRHISLDEMKHKRMIEDLYNKISGVKAPYLKPEEPKLSRNISAELSKSILNEYDEAEFYRRLLLMLKDPEYRDMLFEILTDEQAHGGKLNYLYSKYK